MPDQNPADPTAPGPVSSFGNLGAAAEPPPSTAMDSSELPPAPPIVEPALPETPPVGDIGGAAPTFDISGSMSGTPPPKKRFGGRKFVATILGLLVLVGGLGAGIILVQQQQDIRERAAFDPGGGGGGGTITPTATRAPTPPTAAPTQTPSPPGTAPGGLCPRDCISPKSACAPNSFYPSESQALGYGDCGGIGSNEYCCNSGTGGGTPTPAIPDEQAGERCESLGGRCVEPEVAASPSRPEYYCDKLGQQSCPANEVCIKCAGASTPVPTLTPPPGGGVVAQCLNIRAFDTNWTELTIAQLAQLKAGDKVRFAVGGTASGGSFDKAKFKINGVERPEVTGKRPDSQEYFDEYTLPEGVTTFTINAQIHHSSLGWSN